ncbi:MAG: hypothetical protein KC474_05045 [Cyanobacteria bacterium HKST-UBA04]|nr:hypothetical protein [Cyanobacteria bacterium HKST-UBA04]
MPMASIGWRPDSVQFGNNSDEPSPSGMAGSAPPVPVTPLTAGPPAGMTPAAWRLQQMRQAQQPASSLRTPSPTPALRLRRQELPPLADELEALLTPLAQLHTRPVDDWPSTLAETAHRAMNLFDNWLRAIEDKYAPVPDDVSDDAGVQRARVSTFRGDVRHAVQANVLNRLELAGIKVPRLMQPKNGELPMPEAEARQELARQVKSNVNRLILLARQFAFLERKGLLKPEGMVNDQGRPFSAVSIFTHAVLNAKREAGEKAITFHDAANGFVDDWQLGGRLPLRPDQLYGLISNLVSNAIKYTPNEGAVTVYMGPPIDNANWAMFNGPKQWPGSKHGSEAAKRANTLVIQVADTGDGFDMAELPRLLEEGGRSQQHEHIPGTGYGLGRVKELVESVGGTLEIVNNRDRHRPGPFALSRMFRAGRVPLLMSPVVQGGRGWGSWRLGGSVPGSCITCRIPIPAAADDAQTDADTDAGAGGIPRSLPSLGSAAAL